MKSILSTTLVLIAVSHVYALDRERFYELYSITTDTLNPNNVMALTPGSSFHWAEPTPNQPQGPFYPIIFPIDDDHDLTKINNGEIAKGSIVLVQGQVMDLKATPLVDAKVEIWQACASGKYFHPLDNNSAPLDPNFQYYGSALTDQTGKYIFKTIVPGPYPANDTWWRPPHIHFIITKDGYQPLITQMYFDGSSFTEAITTVNGKEITGEIIDQYNRDDLLLKRLSPEKRSRLIVPFQPLTEGWKIGVFNIYLPAI